MPALHKKYGPIVRISPGQLAIEGPIAWPEIYAHRPSAKEEFGRPAGVFFPRDTISILGAVRQDHRRMRRQLAPAFSDSSMKQQEVTITKYVQLFLDKLEEHSQGGKPLDIVQWINFTMFDIIGDLAFSDSFHSLDNNAYHPWVQSILEVPEFQSFPWATFRDPAHFADPDSFSPQRWLQPSHPLYEERFSKDNRDAFKPFSFGSRDCIGQNLAYAEMRLIVARLLFRFDYKLLPNQQDWHRKQRIYLGWEKGPLNIQLQKRAQV
ncbi:hypothetical protein S40288_07366 [Stachybotrys chartarum IBT 40288]|nr:hypothetical protein S40288_07366 [Stachybotrys chartarum IBT 40288]